MPAKVIIMGNLLQNTIIRVRIHRAIIMGEEWIHRLIAILFTPLIIICKVKLWYIILINGDLCNRARGLHRRKAINAKSGKKRLFLAQLHRSCVSLRAAHTITYPSPRRDHTQAPASKPNCQTRH